MSTDMEPLKTIPMHYNSQLEFVMYVTKITKTLVSFEVYEAQYLDKLRVGDLYFAATVKWDGCSHIHFGDSGYIHLCGKDEWKMHCAVMEWAYNTATVLIEDMDENEFWSD